MQYKNESNILTPHDVIKATAKAFGASILKLNSKTCAKPSAKARMVAMYMFKELLGYSPAEIAGYFRRERFVAYRALNEVEKLKTIDSETVNAINKIKEMLKPTEEKPSITPECNPSTEMYHQDGIKCKDIWCKCNNNSTDQQ